MGDQLVVGGVAERGQAEQAGVVAEAGQQGRFTDRLRRGAANAANADQRKQLPAIRAVHLLAGQREHGLEQPDLRVADRELRRVDADGEAAGARGGVVPRQRALMALVEPAAVIEGQRVRRNHQAPRQRLAYLLVHESPFRPEAALRPHVRLELSCT